MNINLKKKKDIASQLRKSGEYQKALEVYKELWKESKDKFDGSGYLHCLRKLKQYDTALEFVDELKQYSNFDWAKNEMIWTYIEGKLSIFNDKSDLYKAIELAERLVKFNPDLLALQKIVFIVVKLASESNKWDIVNIWIGKIDPTNLSDKPLFEKGGKQIWSYKALWYNYKIKALVNLQLYDEAISIIDSIKDIFPFQQEKFFQRLKALSLHKKGELLASEKLYAKLCQQSNEWWLLYEYSLVVKDIGRVKESLELMYKAASLTNRYNGIVNLILDIAIVNKELKRNEEAEAHFRFYLAIRQKNDWKINSQLFEEHIELQRYKNTNNDFRIILEKCREYWGYAVKETRVRYSINDNRKNVIGKVTLGNHDAPYCFIKSNNESFFCYKSDLPEGVVDNCLLKFDAKTSFDKKKNQKSWKATNITIYSD